MPLAPYTTLISCAELASHLGDSDWRIFDCRHDLADPGAGEAAYAQTHIAGAGFMHLDRDLSSKPTGNNGRHPLPTADTFVETLSRAGVNGSCQVVAYDASGGMYASRLWWMLRWLGHDAVAVLDGGWTDWTAGHFPVGSAPAEYSPSRFVARPRPSTLDSAAVLANLSSRERLVVDARGADRFRGDNETMDPVGGHIPGAVNRSFRDNLDANGRFKDARLLRQDFQSLMAGRPPGTIVHSCGSGVSACHNVLAMEIAGLPGSLLYPGSWSEWCADPSRPIER